MRVISIVDSVERILICIAVLQPHSLHRVYGNYSNFSEFDGAKLTPKHRSYAPMTTSFVLSSSAAVR